MFDISALMGAGQAAAPPAPQVSSSESGGNVIFQFFFNQAVDDLNTAAATSVHHTCTCGQPGNTANTTNATNAVEDTSNDQGNQPRVSHTDTPRVSGPEEPAPDMEVNGVVFSAGRKTQDELRDLFAQILGIEGYGGFSILWVAILPEEAELRNPDDLINVIDAVRKNIRQLEGEALELLPSFAQALRGAAADAIASGQTVSAGIYANLPVPQDGNVSDVKQFIANFFITLKIWQVGVTQETPRQYLENYFGTGVPRLWADRTAEKPIAPAPAAVVADVAPPVEEAVVPAIPETEAAPPVAETTEPETVIPEAAEPEMEVVPEAVTAEVPGPDAAVQDVQPEQETEGIEALPLTEPEEDFEPEQLEGVSPETVAVPVDAEPEGEGLILGGEEGVTQPVIGGGSEAVSVDTGIDLDDKDDGDDLKPDLSNIVASASVRGGAQPVQSDSPQPVQQTTAPQIIDQIADGLQAQGGQTITKLEMELNPASLGRISLAVEHMRDGVSVTLRSASDTVRQMLAGNMADLETVLRNAGINMKNLRIEQPGIAWDFARNGPWREDGSSRQQNGRDGSRRAGHTVSRPAAAAAENHMAAFLYGAGVTQPKTDDVSLDIRA